MIEKKFNSESRDRAGLLRVALLGKEQIDWSQREPYIITVNYYFFIVNQGNQSYTFEILGESIMEASDEAAYEIKQLLGEKPYVHLGLKGVTDIPHDYQNLNKLIKLDKNQW